jgi:hypothetical protein
MNGTDTLAILTAAALLLAPAVGAGVVAAEDFPSVSDGDLSNGEVLKVAEDDDDQVKQINYTFVLADHTPGKEVSAKHFAVGLTENATLHRIKLFSEDFGYSNCEPDNTAAFGIDRGDDDPGTKTDVSLLTSFKKYTSEEDFIDILYYKEDKLAGSPISGSVYDEIVASQNGCYDNPAEPGWYRINGTITGSSNGDAQTDYKIRDLSQWIYICDCSSRAEAERTLGPPPGQESDGGGGDGGGSDPTPTATSTPDTGGASDPTATAAATATRTATATPTVTATATATHTATATATHTATATTAATATGTATPTAGDSESGAPSGGSTATATAAGGNDATTASATAARAAPDSRATLPPRPSAPVLASERSPRSSARRSRDCWRSDATEDVRVIRSVSHR